MTVTQTPHATLVDLVFEKVSVGLCLVAPDSTIVRANSEWLRSTGFTEEQVVGENIIELFPATRDMTLAMHARARAGHRVDVPRHAHVVNGRETLWEGSIEAVPMEGGTGLLITARELTSQAAPSGADVPVDRATAARERVGEALRRHEKTFSELVERAPFGIYVVDSRFRIAHMNAGSQIGAFRNVRPVIGRDFSEAMRILWPEPVAAEIIAAFRHTLDTGEPYFSPRFINPRADVGVLESYEWELHRIELPDGQHGVICYYFDSTKLREAEEALRDSEHKLRVALDRLRVHVESTPLAVVEWNAEYRVMGFSARAQEVLGWTAGEVVGKRIDEIPWVPEEDWPSVRGVMHDMSIGARPANVNANRNVRKDGTIIHCEWYNSTLYDEQGRLRSVLSFVLDVTERKRADERLAADVAALTRMHALSARVVEAAGVDPLLQETMDAAVAIMAADKGTLQLLEGDTLRIVAQCGHEKPFLDFFAEAESVASVCGEATRIGERVLVPDVETSPIFLGNASLPVLRAAGVRAVQSTPLQTRAARLLGILTTHWSRPHTPDEHDLWRLDLLARQAADLIEQKRAEEALRASERLHRLIADVAEIAARVPDIDELVEAIAERVANELGVSRCGFSRVDLETGVVEVLKDSHGDRPSIAGVYPMDKYMEHWLEDGYAGRPALIEDVATHPRTAALYETAFAPIQVRAHLTVPLHREGRWVANFWASHHERRHWTTAEVDLMRFVADRVWALVERRRAEQALRDANERLREADRRKDEFLGMLSHELRNPLAPIRNSTYILEHAVPGSEQARRAQAVIQRQTDHLTRLVDDLLDVTRIVRGKIELRRARVDLRDVVWRAADDFRFVMRDRGVRFDVVVPEAQLWSDADATRITQVVGNLLHNAAKFTHSGDEVTVMLGHDGRMATLRVRDTGVGIDSELLPKVFDAFVQGERTLARTEGGLGLGLALVKGLTELHGGTVRANSSGKGKGSEFVLTIPLLASRSAGRASAARLERQNGGRRVLVVEDNPDAAESLADVVRIGHTVEVAFNGPSAIEAARANAPDIVLCDIGLPDMDGYEVAKALRSVVREPMQLIAVTGYAQPEDVKRAVEAGFDAHVADPAQIERLLR